MIHFLRYLLRVFDEQMFKMSPLVFAVCAEAYNPDEEEDDAESRVCNLLN